MNLKASEVACVNLVTSLKAFVFISANDARKPHFDPLQS